MVRVQRFTLVNAYLRPFPNYDGVPLVSIAILVRPELRVTCGSRLWLCWRPFPQRLGVMGVLVESVCGRGSPTSRAAAIGISASPSRGRLGLWGPSRRMVSWQRHASAPRTETAVRASAKRAAGSQSQA